MFLLAACGEGEPGGTARDAEVGEAAGAEASTSAGGERSGASDSLVVVANMDGARLHLLPRDWQDLFHFRYAGRILVLDPGTSASTRAFMEAVLRAEARRTGVADAGFDWLRRLDRATLRYEADADDAAFRLGRGEADFALLPVSGAGPLLDRPGFQIVPMASGADPDRWGREAGADSSSGPEPPRDWLAIWAAEVRGRG